MTGSPMKFGSLPPLKRTNGDGMRGKRVNSAGTVETVGTDILHSSDIQESSTTTVESLPPDALDAPDS